MLYFFFLFLNWLEVLKKEIVFTTADLIFFYSDTNLSCWMLIIFNLCLLNNDNWGNSNGEIVFSTDQGCYDWDIANSTMVFSNYYTLM